MFEALAGLFAGGAPFLLGRRGRRGSPQDAYERAWWEATRSGYWATSVLRSALQDEGVRGCYDDESSPQISIFFHLWAERVPPKKANEVLRTHVARR